MIGKVIEGNSLVHRSVDILNNFECSNAVLTEVIAEPQDCY